MSRPPKPTCGTSNWIAYDQELGQRGSLTVCFDPSMPWRAIPSGRRGCQQAHGDAAMQTCLALKVLPGLPLRQGEPAKRHRIKPAGTVRARLLRARLRHPVMAAERDGTVAPEAPRKPDGDGRDHSVPRFERRLAPARPLSGSGQHRHQGGRRRRAAQPQAWRLETPGLSEDPPRDRRGNAGDPVCRSHFRQCRRCRAVERHRSGRTGAGCCRGP